MTKMNELKVSRLPVSLGDFQNCYIHSFEVLKILQEQSKNCEHRGELFLSISLKNRECRGAKILARLCESRIEDDADIVRCDMRVWKLFTSTPALSGCGHESSDSVKEEIHMNVSPSSPFPAEVQVVNEDKERQEIDLAHQIMRLEGTSCQELWNKGKEEEEEHEVGEQESRNQITLAMKFNDTLRCTSNDIQILRLGTIKVMRLTVIFSAVQKQHHSKPVLHSMDVGSEKEQYLALSSSLSACDSPLQRKLLCEKIRDIFIANEIKTSSSALIDLRHCALSSVSFNVPSISYVYVESCDIYAKSSDPFPINSNKGIGKINSSTEIVVSTTRYVDYYKRLYDSITPSTISLAGLDAPMKLIEETIGMQEYTREARSRGRETRKSMPTDNGHFSHGLLIAGSPGCGKTLVVHEAAKKLRANLLVFNAATAAKPIHDVSGFSETCTNIFSRAVTSAQSEPTILLLEDLEVLCTNENKNPDSTSTLFKAKLVNHLCELFDSIPAHVSLTIVVTSNKPHLLPPKLRRSGRVQQELYIKMPTEHERLGILQGMVKNIPVFTKYDLTMLARQTPGYAGADLERLVHLIALKANEENCSSVLDSHVKYALSQIIPTLLQGSMGLVDIQRANSLDHIAGLQSVKLDLIKAIVWPLKYPQSFLNMGIRPPKGILLYGPPGCAKTTLVRAIAASYQTNFLAVSAAELFSSGVGDSEKIIADLFHRARSASPSILFIDELEAVVGSRQSSSKGSAINETILSTLLTEMDGVGVSTPVAKSTHDEKVVGVGLSVIVVAATNRPDLIDSALLRPGRLDRIIPVPPPNEYERLELLKKCAEKIPLRDVNLEELAAETDRYSGADLVNLCNEAALFAMEENRDIPSVSKEHFDKAKAHSSPSISLESLKLFHDYSNKPRQ